MPRNMPTINLLSPLPGGGPNRRRVARPGRGRRGRMGRSMGSKAMYSAGGLAGAMQVQEPN